MEKERLQNNSKDKNIHGIKKQKIGDPVLITEDYEKITKNNCTRRLKCNKETQEDITVSLIFCFVYGKPSQCP